MWAAPIITVPPLTEPVTVEQAKGFLSIAPGEAEFDGLIGSFIVAARQQAEAITGTAIAQSTVELRACEFGDLLRLPIAPVRQVLSISYRDRDGVTRAIAAEAYELAGAGLQQGIRPMPGYGWPDDLRKEEGAIIVTADVGYGDLPGPIWTAILLMVGDLFAFRETAVTGTVAAQIPSSMTVSSLLANYRIWL